MAIIITTKLTKGIHPEPGHWIVPCQVLKSILRSNTVSAEQFQHMKRRVIGLAWYGTIVVYYYYYRI